MTIIETSAAQHGDELVATVDRQLLDASSSVDDFRRRLEGPIYDENSDVARFILTSLAEDTMTKETRTDLWLSEKGHYVWTIEHIFPQGENLPATWKDMMGGAEAAAQAQQSRVHHLGNLTITAYNSNLGNKSFQEKRDRTDPKGRPIGYRNGLALNADLCDRETWTVEDIDERTHDLAERVLRRFPLE